MPVAAATPVAGVARPLKWKKGMRVDHGVKVLAGESALAAQLEGSIEEDERVPVVPAKLLNNTAVLKYRCAQRERTVQGLRGAPCSCLWRLESLMPGCALGVEEGNVTGQGAQFGW
jgi:hypothetical protein